MRERVGAGAGSAAGDALAGKATISGGAVASDAPHLWQWFIPRLLTAEQAGHSVSCRSAAHSLQYFAVAGLS